jgi:hypothetical protein
MAKWVWNKLSSPEKKLAASFVVDACLQCQRWAKQIGMPPTDIGFMDESEEIIEDHL